MDETRWMSVAKSLNPSLKYLSAVVSSLNYFFSEKGYGSEKFLSCKRAFEMVEE